MTLRITPKDCCGCTACSHICPMGAIWMCQDKEGFAYPVVDEMLCSHCGMCEQICPVTNPPKIADKYTGCFVAQNMNADVLLESTSGGFMDVLNQYILEKKQGRTVGVVFDSSFLPVHRIACTAPEAALFRTSKYAQSDLGTVFIQIQRLLEGGIWVLFTGTPCQVAGLKAYLGTDYSTLITADLVCRSVPSPVLWRKYLDWQETQAGSHIRSVSCRRKTYGYHHGTLEICFENGKRYSGSNRVDYFMKAFHADICSRPSCYSCPFKTPHRCSDFTVFDCGHPAEVALEPVTDDDRGFSSVLVHTDKGLALTEELENVRLIPANPERMFDFTGAMERGSIVRKDARNSFYEDLEAVGFLNTVKKYITVSVSDRIIERIKPVWYCLRKKNAR